MNILIRALSHTYNLYLYRQVIEIRNVSILLSEVVGLTPTAENVCVRSMNTSQYLGVFHIIMCL